LIFLLIHPNPAAAGCQEKNLAVSGSCRMQGKTVRFFECVKVELSKVHFKKIQRLSFVRFLFSKNVLLLKKSQFKLSL
jgi:hypothetical protein